MTQWLFLLPIAVGCISSPEGPVQIQSIGRTSQRCIHAAVENLLLHQSVTYLIERRALIRPGCDFHPITDHEN